MRNDQTNQRAPDALRSMKTSDQTKLALMDQKLDYIVRRTDELTDTVKENYATKGETAQLVYEIAQLKERADKTDRIIWSVIGVVFLSVGGAVMGLILVHH